MLKLNEGPRFGLALLEQSLTAEERSSCVNCGWRRIEIHPDVLAEVQILRIV